MAEEPSALQSAIMGLSSGDSEPSPEATCVPSVVIFDVPGPEPAELWHA